MSAGPTRSAEAADRMAVRRARTSMTSTTGERELTNTYRLSGAATLTALGSDPVRGLSEAEARARLEHTGRNELISEPPVPAWRRFLVQFENVLVILLLVATAISAGVWWYERDSTLPFEAIAILAIVCLNAIMGYVQEAQAERTVAALRAMSAAEARVIRDGEHHALPATEIVPGDIILIEEGDTIPADARLLQVVALQTAEAALTGESVPVSKDTQPISDDVGLGDRHNMIFSGTAATYGRGMAVVVATGMQTEIGSIAGLLRKSVDEPTPLQRELDRIGKHLGLLVGIMAVVIIGTILLVDRVTEFAAIIDVLILGVALAVAAVPEGLPAVVTAVLAIGVRRMSQRHAIVRRLASVETLGSASVIASDKTGTLTRNEMTVRAIVTASGHVRVTGAGYSPEGDIEGDRGEVPEGALRREVERALQAADHANNAVLQQRDGQWIVHGDPTEGALLVAAKKCGIDKLRTRFPRVAEVPFSSERKLMSTVHREVGQEELVVFTKGAPEVVLARCSHELVGGEARQLTEPRRNNILQTNEKLAGEALRALGAASGSVSATALDGDRIDERVEHDLVFLGLIGMIDPPRKEAGEAVARTKRAGIRPVMITGDHPATAAVIAEELGILDHGRVMTGSELMTATDETLGREASVVSVYARVNPADKVRIVRALQSAGAVVAMTGDGVNDAPALKAADIGVAMGITGTDVSREAADMVLTDDNFSSIVAAVEEGRAIFANIRKFLRYLLSSNVGEVLTMFAGVLLASVMGMKVEDGAVVSPLLATQILWINLVTDGAPALALGLDPPDADLMKRAPRPIGEPVITRKMWGGILLVGAVMATGTLFVFDACLPGGLIEGTGDLRYAQTMTFTTLVLFQMFNVLNARSEERSAFAGLLTNNWLWASIGLSLALQIAAVYAPFLQQALVTTALSPSDWLRATVVASSVLWIRELQKMVTAKGRIYA
jgi:P-type Ca2+ transporter type 2C